MTLVILRLVWRTLALGALWLVLSGGGYLTYGVPVVLLAVAFLCVLSSPFGGFTQRRPHVMSRALGMVHLGLWFLWQSVKGGADVAARAVRRPVAIEPHYEELPVILPPGAALDLSMLMISLLPGSLGVQLRDDQLCMHVLSPELDAAGQWNTLQQLAARTTGVVTLHTPL